MGYQIHGYEIGFTVQTTYENMREQDRESEQNSRNDLRSEIWIRFKIRGDSLRIWNDGSQIQISMGVSWDLRSRSLFFSADLRSRYRSHAAI